jgi:hypothetical protein
MNRKLFFLFLMCLICFQVGGYAQAKEEVSAVPVVTTPVVDEGGEKLVAPVKTDDEEDAVDNPNLSRQGDERYFTQPADKNGFKEGSWKKAGKGINFIKDAEEVKKPLEENSTNKVVPKTPVVDNLVLIPFFKYLFYGLGIAAIAFLIYRLVEGGNIFGTSGKRVPSSVSVIDLEHIEENLQEIDLDPLITEAVTTKQFSLAIRLYYLATLKELAAKGSIRWQRDKTNRIYLSEMVNNPLFGRFKATTQVFERIWYGGTALEESSFLVLQPEFKALLADARK